jgi:nucleoside-triphosphatase
MPHAIAKNILLTGLPGCGKTTVIRRVVERLGHLRLAGLYTQEIRQHGQCVGFEAVGMHGQSARLAHVDFHGAERVGRYGVDIGGFEAIVQQELGQADEVVDLFVIDEIGRMECLSQGFVQAITRTLNSPVPVLATIAAKGGRLIAQVKARSDVENVAVTAENRDRLANEMADRIPE